MPMNRREALARLGGLIGGGWLAGLAGAQTSSTVAGKSSSATLTGASAPVAGKPFSIAHITDVHLFEHNGAEKWFAHCLHKIQEHESRPSLLINTGDCVMDSLKADRQRADYLWGLWKNVLKKDLSIPARHCLGNHDYWGLGLAAENKAIADDKMSGAGLAMEALGMDKLYDSFDMGDWHIVLLDSVKPAVGTDQSGWIAELDDEQFRWLKKDLETTPADRPVVVFSHIPIVQICSMEYLRPNDRGQYAWNPNGMMHDARRIVDLFKKHPNVKLCLSGHIHLRDRVELLEVTYICDGAVCGAWWKGPRNQVSPGYSVVTLHPDGKFDCEYTPYGWNDSAVSKA